MQQVGPGMQVPMPHLGAQAQPPLSVVMPSAGSAHHTPEPEPSASRDEQFQAEQEKLAQTFTASLRQLGTRYAQEIWAIHITQSHLEQLEREALVSRAEHAAIAEKVMENDKLIQEMKEQVDMLRSIDWVQMKKKTEA
jgi:hypothetical protein